MKIALCGNFVVDYCSEVHYKRTLEAMGHTVIPLQENQLRTEEILRQATFSDLFVWVHSHGFKNRGRYTMGQVLQQLAARNVPTMGYHLDLYMGLQRWQDYQSHDYFKVKHFFTVDKLMADWLNENTQTKGYYLPPGVLEQECYLADPHPEYKQEVVFTGARGYHHEWAYRPMMIDFLAKTYGDKFGHFGGDGIKLMRGNELNQLYASSKVVVGDTLNIGFSYPYYSSDRFYEVMGRGGFLIYPKIENFAPDYEDGKHVVYYKHGDLNDLKEKIDYYLAHDKEREKIRLAGHELTKSKNTYTNRWQTMIDEVEKHRNG